MVGLLGFSIYKIMSSSNSDRSSFSVWMLFIYFSCLILFNTMLNKCGETGHPCSWSQRDSFPFSMFSMMLAVGVSYKFCLKKYITTPWSVFPHPWFNLAHQWSNQWFKIWMFFCSVMHLANQKTILIFNLKKKTTTELYSTT